MKRFLGILLALVLVFSLVTIGLPSSVLAQSSDVWVDDDWAGSSPGDPIDGHIFGTDAFATIQDGVDAVASPGTVHVAAGIYNEGVSVGVWGAKNNLTLVGEDKLTTIVDGTGVVSGSGAVFKLANSDGITVSGFTVRNGGYGIRLDNCENNTISNNIILSNETGGIILFWSHSTTITQNEIRLNRTQDGIGISGPATGNIITSNEVASNDRHGIKLYKATDHICTNNVIVTNGMAGIYCHSNSSATNTNNTIVGNTLQGIFSDGSSLLAMKNSIIWGNGDDLDGCTATYSNIEDGDLGEGNISADPEFVDAAYGDYRLQPGSPCIDAGTNEDAPTEDIEGNLRPIDGDLDGSAITDMGAYESLPSPDITVSPSSIAFGSVVVGSSSSPQIVTATNDGDAEVTIGTITTIGADVAEFSIQNDNCSGQTLAPAASANLEVVFSPTSVGSKSASTSIRSDDPDEGAVYLALTGIGIAPDIRVSPSSIAFVSVVVGSSSWPQTVTVNNDGDASLTMGTITITGPDAAEFSIQNDNCSGETLAPGASATLEVVFNPTSAGSKSASLFIPSDDPDEATVNLTLSGVDQLAGPWPMFRHDPWHTGRSPHTGPQQNPTLKWSFTTGGAVESSPAIGADGTIYAGSNDGKLYAINPDGPLKWSFTTGGSIGRSSPAISANGTIYVGSSDGKLYAINPDGSLKWSYTTGGSIDWSPPVIAADGTVFVGDAAQWDSKLYAVNPDGTLKWSYTDDSMYAIRSSPAVAADGTIYVGSGDRLYAINPDGSLSWRCQIGSNIYSSPAIGADGTIYIGTDKGILYAYNPDGTFKWSWSYTWWEYIRSSPAIAADGTIYFGQDKGILCAVNPDGTERWIYWGGWHGWDTEYHSSPAVGADGTIYVGCGDDKLHAVNPDGSGKWSFTTGGDVRSSPAIGADGTIYVGSNDNKLYAIGEPDITVAPSSIGFGLVMVGSSSLPEIVTVTNDGSADLILGTVTISGPEAAEFSIQNDNCSGQTLSPGTSDTLEVVFSPTSASSKSATLSVPSNDPDESLVDVALSGSAIQIVPATIDFNPHTLNLKSKGKVVTVYIELLEGYDVGEIDISTLTLNDMVPALMKPTAIGDYDSDGVPDLMVKLNRSGVQDLLEPGDEVEVTVTGELADGTPFVGSDTIRVIEKGKK